MPHHPTASTGARVEVDTPSGPAWADLDVVEDARAVVLLGHGAGGTVDAPDLLATRDAAVQVSTGVVRVTQPYRVSGRRAPAPAARLDEAWLAVAAWVRAHESFAGLPVIFGGRSSGARVACRCAAVGGASAVVALAFPVHPPSHPEKSRLEELTAVTCPLLVVQGLRDAFGQPPVNLFTTAGRTLATVRATHALATDLSSIGAAVRAFIERIGAPPTGGDDG